MFLSSSLIYTEAYIDDGIVQFHPTGSIREIRLDDGRYATEFTIQVRDVRGNIISSHADVLNEILVGFVATFGADMAPSSGWLECNGASYATADYPILFARIGTTYGGAGANFNVPDFRGMYLRGLSEVSLEPTYTDDRDPDKLTRTLNSLQVFKTGMSNTYKDSFILVSNTINHTHSINDISFTTFGNDNSDTLNRMSNIGFKVNAVADNNRVFGSGGDAAFDASAASKLRHLTNEGGEHTHSITVNDSLFDLETHPRSQVLKYYIKADS